MAKPDPNWAVGYAAARQMIEFATVMLIDFTNGLTAARARKFAKWHREQADICVLAAKALDRWAAAREGH